MAMTTIESTSSYSTIGKVLLLVLSCSFLLSRDNGNKIIYRVDAFSCSSLKPQTSTTTAALASPKTITATTTKLGLFFAAEEGGGGGDTVVEESIDVSIPYDAAARLAFDADDDKGDISFEDYQKKYTADAIELVKSKGFFASSSTVSSSPATTNGETNTLEKNNPLRGNPLLDGMEGSTKPIPSFDPINLAGIGSDETLRWFRAAELKHSRVAMLASTGYIVQAMGFHFPGMLSNANGGISFESLSQVKPLEAWDMVPDAGKAQILFFAFIGELASESQGTHYMKGGKYPEVVFPKFDFSNVSDETMFTKRNRELNNGRLAMLGIISFISANNIPGSVPALAGLDMF